MIDGYHISKIKLYALMKTSTVIWIVVIVIVIAGGVYWFATQSSNTSTATSQQATTTTPTAAPTISLGNSAQFSNYLVAANGMTLYTFASDSAGVSKCVGSCAVAWPPYIVPSATGLTAAAGITGTVGTITRSDGTIQVTYNGMPLYFFAKDGSVGQVTGNGVAGFSLAMATVASTQPAATQTTAPAATAPATPATPAYNY
jgi:predicted lipoprotein with Yx(FWY)xxD motif